MEREHNSMIPPPPESGTEAVQPESGELLLPPRGYDVDEYEVLLDQLKGAAQGKTEQFVASEKAVVRDIEQMEGLMEEMQSLLDEHEGLREAVESHRDRVEVARLNAEDASDAINDFIHEHGEEPEAPVLQKELDRLATEERAAYGEYADAALAAINDGVWERGPDAETLAMVGLPEKVHPAFEKEWDALAKDTRLVQIRKRLEDMGPEMKELGERYSRDEAA